ncbi:MULTISPECIES: hypothetical protein [unclassified Streptomyces]|nr:hypothetical protein [Streptomyces sp. NBC_01788]WSB30384.1 hypothetical protein OIE49_33515 [Streptomyces sp. NBC_01788]
MSEGAALLLNHPEAVALLSRWALERARDPDRPPAVAGPSVAS